MEKHFALRERGTTVAREIMAGLTTFLTMAYIIFVNAQVLSNIPALKGSVPALAAATCLAAAIPTLLMGLWTNMPLALAPGMGLNGALAFGLCLGRGVSWQTAMGVIVVEGILITLLVLVGLRESILRAIPLALRHAIAAGIGLFLALLGMVNAGLVRMNLPSAPLTFGNVHDRGVQVAIIGAVITFALFALRWRAALLAGILIATVLALLTGVAKPPEVWLQVPDFATFGQADVVGALQPALWASVLAFLMSDFFDSMGTVLGVGREAGLTGPEGEVPRLREVLLVDSCAAWWGGLCGASSATAYIESASGVAEGGRTGLTAVTVGVLFLASLFFAPLAGVVPPQATAAALIVVGFLMLKSVRDIAFDRVEEALPAFVTLITIPFTYSIARGIGYGFISYVVILCALRRWRDLHPLMVGVTLLFALAFALE
ncbi:MAG: NCS2 family permease [Chloroherpetonaceae bacterium]|nr:NCS2 family permease [Chthonomonadaceae bacterium]MDW8207452.1 NCS2 family permease [Chloroherpetonaceae bacterium]